MNRLAFFAPCACFASALVLLAACSSSSSGIGVLAGEAGIPANDGAAAGDAGSDASASDCEGACKTTSLAADFGGNERTLSRAQFGTQQGDDGSPELHVEAHLGGDSVCPDEQSPSPDYTLIVDAIPRGRAGQTVKETDGVSSAFFDFKADLGLAAPSGISKAISVNVTVVAEDTATPPAWVALDVSIGFTEGSVKGHLYAAYCPSLTE
jgi:hypothetical protein